MADGKFHFGEMQLIGYDIGISLMRSDVNTNSSSIGDNILVFHT